MSFTKLTLVGLVLGNSAIIDVALVKHDLNLYSRMNTEIQAEQESLLDSKEHFPLTSSTVPGYFRMLERIAERNIGGIRDKYTQQMILFRYFEGIREE